jgi:hypothetical protein
MPKKIDEASHEDFTDDYYRAEARKAINDAVEEALAANRPPDEVRFLLRRAYPFEKPRRNRPYKIWRRAMLAKEAELGFPPKTHKGKEAKKKPEKPQVAFSSLALLRGSK